MQKSGSSGRVALRRLNSTDFRPLFSRSIQEAHRHLVLPATTLVGCYHDLGNGNQSQSTLDRNGFGEPRRGNHDHNVAQ